MSLTAIPSTPGKRIRLVGFDAPELGDHAHCGLERMLAARATSQLRQMIQLSNDIDLQIVDCSCRPGPAGTMACYLTIEGQDVGDVLIAEKQAHPLMCGKYSCPPRRSWRPLVPGPRHRLLYRCPMIVNPRITTPSIPKDSDMIKIAAAGSILLIPEAMK
jgi:hypothetical protein